MRIVKEKYLKMMMIPAGVINVMVKVMLVLFLMRNVINVMVQEWVILCII